MVCAAPLIGWHEITSSALTAFACKGCAMIFILGGRGFVGSAFVRYCQQNRLEHTVIDRANYAEFIGHSCDVLINANGNSKKFLAHQQPLQDFDASVRSVRASLIDFHAALYIYLSSCDVYPDCSSPILT